MALRKFANWHKHHSDSVLVVNHSGSKELMRVLELMWHRLLNADDSAW
jgi:hypothetical protein